MWAPVAQRQNKKEKVGAGARVTRFTALPVAPPKTLARSDLRGAEATGSSAAAALHHRRTLILDLDYGSASSRHGQQWRLRLIDRRYAISLSLSVFTLG
jgi:hypothetical protein